ncbi:MAG TPA: hypothetical protein VKI44_38290 [Acetobacteraceae bacterium]|nr:hypothetical protein [Acetobacteraceae bacterium]
MSRIPNSTYRLYGKTARAVRDIKGLRLLPDADLAEAPAQKVTTLRWYNQWMPLGTGITDRRCGSDR